MKHYELVCLLPADQTEEELIPVRNKIAKVLTDNGGRVLFEEVLGKRKLAYPIKRVKTGYYILVKAELEPETLGKLNTVFQHDPLVVRHLFVQVNPGAFDRKHISNRPRFQAEAPKSSRKKEIPVAKLSQEELSKKIEEILDTPLTE